MIEFRSGDIFDSDVDALVNTVNCEGVMGRGIALQFKKRFPKNFVAYAKACSEGEVRPGRMFVYDTGRLTSPRYIINFPTKRQWRNKSRMEDIESGLDALIQFIREKEIHSVAIPPLGSGLGGLDWKRVKARMLRALSVLEDVSVVVYEPSGSPDPRAMAASLDVPKMTLGRAALVSLLHRYQLGLLDPFISLLEIHKLMYFLQETGEPLQLRYVKAPYGPYAENLRHTLNAIEGHLIVGYADGGDDPEKHIELSAGAVEAAQAFLTQEDPIQARIDRVSDLIAGFESPFGLELLTSVHWVMQYDGAWDATEVEMSIANWSERKRAMFSARQLGIARARLIANDCIRSSATDVSDLTH